jgi:hypothetical protein
VHPFYSSTLRRREPKCVVHFYHSKFKRCDIMDKHLAVSLYPLSSPSPQPRVLNLETRAKILQYAIFPRFCRERPLARRTTRCQSASVCNMLCGRCLDRQVHRDVQSHGSPLTICKADRVRRTRQQRRVRHRCLGAKIGSLR